MNFTITKLSDKNFAHFDGFKEMNFSNWEIVFNNTDNTTILQMRNGAPFPKMKVLATDVIIKDGVSGTPETFTTTAQIRERLIELGYNPLIFSSPSGGAVDSVNGQTGVVVLDADDIAETATRKWQSANQDTFNDATSSIQTQLDNKQATLTETNFGSFANGLTAKTTLVDADLTNLVDSADSNKAKKVTWLNVWNYIKGKADAIYASKTFIENISFQDSNTSITAQTYVIELYAQYTYTINELKIISDLGTCSVAVKINGTNVTGLSAVSVSTTIANGTATALNTVAVGDKITLVVSSPSTLNNLQASLKTTRT